MRNASFKRCIDMFSEYCVCFASFDVAFYEVGNGVWDVCGCRSFLVSLCMFSVSRAVLMSSATVSVRAGVSFD